MGCPVLQWVNINKCIKAWNSHCKIIEVRFFSPIVYHYIMYVFDGTQPQGRLVFT